MASGVTTVFLSQNLQKLSERLKLFSQEIQAGKNSDLINKAIVAIVDKSLEYKCISKKQHNQILNESNLSHK